MRGAVAARKAQMGTRRHAHASKRSRIVQVVPLDCAESLNHRGVGFDGTPSADSVGEKPVMLEVIEDIAPRSRGQPR